MEHTIEQIQNDIMNRMQQFDFGDRVTILRELEKLLRTAGRRSHENGIRHGGNGGRIN